MKSNPLADRVFLGAKAGALLILLVFAINLAFSRHSELKTGQAKTERFNAMLAEHTARTFDAVDILLRELSSDLTRAPSDWRNWNESEGWTYLAQRHSRSMPQIMAITLFNANGKEVYGSTPGIGLRKDISRQDYFSEVINGKKNSRHGPFFDEKRAQFTYTLGQRIVDPQGNFSGLAEAALDLVFLQNFCWPNRLSEDFESVLINPSGVIVASCRPSDHGRQSSMLGRPSQEILFNGALKNRPYEEGSVLQDGFVVAQTTIPGYPELRMITVAPEASVLTDWRKRMTEVGLLGFMVLVIILTGGFLMRQQLEKVSRITQELESNHALMEKNVELATRQVAEERDRAERANVAKSRFLAAASHDLRQPMHALSMFATDLLAQARTGTYRELPRLAEQISTSTRLLSDLLDSLLDISRLDVAGITPALRNFPLQPVFERLYMAHRRNAKDKKQFLRLRATPLWVYSDADLLERIIGNLLTNALRYTPENGRILIAARTRGERILIEVRDNGIGIAPENQAAIFAEFYQVANAAREQHQGLGLGLSIVDRLAKALKIDITLRSSKNRGTVFTLSVQGKQAAMESLPHVLPEITRLPLFFIGNGLDLRAAEKMAANWGYPTRLMAVTDAIPEGLPERYLVISEYPLIDKIREDWPGNPRLIALTPAMPGDEAGKLPEGVQRCPLPLRPASLRALLAQPQNTSSKSIP